MTSNRPRRPDRSRRQPSSRNPNERPDRGSDFGDVPDSDPRAQQRHIASAALAQGDGDEPARQRHRPPTGARSHGSRWRAATIAGVIVLVILLIAGVFTGIQL